VGIEEALVRGALFVFSGPVVPNLQQGTQGKGFFLPDHLPHLVWLPKAFLLERDLLAKEGMASASEAKNPIHATANNTVKLITLSFLMFTASFARVVCV
jgi:hypothetical protein